jgi:hypothetical protein
LSGQFLAPPSPVEGCSLLGDSPIDVTTGVNLPVQLVVEHEAPPSGIETPSVAPWTEVLLGPAGPIPDGELTDWTAVEAHYSTGNAEGEPPGDLYNASVVISDEGSFQILGRVSTDKGLTWTLCDRPTPDTAHGSTDGISSADTLLITSSAQPHLPVVGLPFITEFQLGSTEQAWIEVHNDSWTALDLSMCGISVDDLFFGWLDGAQTVVEPQGWMQIDGEVAESLLIEAEMGAITLICAEQTIDTTAELSALPFGDVMNAFLKPEKKSAQANDAPKSWCISADSTPGAANPSCAP